MKFSQRIGKTPPVKEIQIEWVDSDLRNGLWDGVKMHLLDTNTSQRKSNRKLLVQER